MIAANRRSLAWHVTWKTPRTMSTRSRLARNSQSVPASMLAPSKNAGIVSAAAARVGQDRRSSTAERPDSRTLDSTAAVLIVDDDEDLCELLQLRFSSVGYDVTIAPTGRDALAALAQQRFHALILDVRLADGDGLQLLRDVREHAPELPVIVLTAHGTIELAVEAMRRGAFGFLTKPFHDHELRQTVAHAVETVTLRREVEGLRRIVGDAQKQIIGVSRGIFKVREFVSRLAPTDVTVLITGESGTGKELVARALHAQSQRAANPFVAINCAALPSELLESELFGHVRGAFTGAQRDREGVFAAAEGGTLFLDEIGDASLAVQAKLLRVLQERRYNRVGSTVEVGADVRVVAATNRDLRADVAAGRFREDLLFRLHVVPLRMPPLRERADDIPVLAELFLERTAERYGRRVPGIAADALNLLIQYRWPGNVRELANVMEAALLLAHGNLIEAKHLEALMLEEATPRPAARDFPDDAVARLLEVDELPPLREVRDSVERAYLEEVLRRSDGNVTAAARRAGRTRSDFYELLRRHQISTARFKTSA
jgi:two-component system response regulator GlrR